MPCYRIQSQRPNNDADVMEPVYGERAPAGRPTLDGQPRQAEGSIIRNGHWHMDVEAQRTGSLNAQEIDTPKREGEVSIDSLRADDGVPEIPAEGRGDGGCDGDEHNVEWHAERLTRDVLEARRGPAIEIFVEKMESSASSTNNLADRQPVLGNAVLDYQLNISQCRHELKRFRDATEFMLPESKFVPLYKSTRVRIFRRCDSTLRNLRRLPTTSASSTPIREELHWLAMSLSHFESLLAILSDSERLPEANVFSLLSYSIQFYSQKFKTYQGAIVLDLISPLNEDIKGLSTAISKATESVNSSKRLSQPQTQDVVMCRSTCLNLQSHYSRIFYQLLSIFQSFRSAYIYILSAYTMSSSIFRTLNCKVRESSGVLSLRNRTEALMASNFVSRDVKSKM
ncbi:hypothetical protein EVG20_g9068 [Dentipellis fragilis]|uniref:Uncharacterized protein n=1 Tax=Dentipellis fragilis TaxID=205917 RepID=A0A4Y9Y135_9AGAM|nr:hypothetical protein EVG20_g9068 [Dentipellis fragilis]